MIIVLLNIQRLVLWPDKLSLLGNVLRKDVSSMIVGWGVVQTIVRSHCFMMLEVYLLMSV